MFVLRPNLRATSVPNVCHQGGSCALICSSEPAEIDLRKEASEGAEGKIVYLPDANLGGQQPGWARPKRPSANTPDERGNGGVLPAPAFISSWNLGRELPLSFVADLRPSLLPAKAPQ